MINLQSRKRLVQLASFLKKRTLGLHKVHYSLDDPEGLGNILALQRSVKGESSTN
jgi:hypothetical protein